MRKSCRIHVQIADVKQCTIHRIKSNKVKSSVIKAMIKENLLNPKSMFICTSCASFAEENMLSPEQSFLDLVVQKILNGCRTW